MATSDERREVAERLRGLPSTADADGCCTVWDVLFALGVEQCGAIGFVRADDAQRLADLIEPTCEDEADVNPVDGFMCSACGWWGNAQQAWSNGWGEPDFDSPTEYAIRFCPNCGARVVRPNVD